MMGLYTSGLKLHDNIFIDTISNELLTNKTSSNRILNRSLIEKWIEQESSVWKWEATEFLLFYVCNNSDYNNISTGHSYPFCVLLFFIPFLPVRRSEMDFHRSACIEERAEKQREISAMHLAIQHTYYFKNLNICKMGYRTAESASERASELCLPSGRIFQLNYSMENRSYCYPLRCRFLYILRERMSFLYLACVIVHRDDCTFASCRKKNTVEKPMQTILSSKQWLHEQF